MKQFKWTKQRPTKGFSYPTSREGASLTYVPAPHNILLLFGGISNGRLNDLMVFDLNQQMWRNQESKGRQPAPRCYHVSFYDEKSDNVFFYAGQGDKGRSLSDFYVLSMTTFMWKRLFLLEMPQSRHNHTITDVGNYEREKIIFGGACLPENLLLNDVWIFNYSQVTFQSNVPEIPGAQCTLKQTKGDVPSGRKGHAAVLFKQNLFMFGGKSLDNSENTTQMYSLNLSNFIWSKVNTIGKGPTSRGFFSFALYNDDRIFMFGGIENSNNKILNETYMFSLKDLYWSAPFTAGTMPTPRYHHATCLIDKNDYQQIVIVGGLELTFQAMDLYYFSEVVQNQPIQWEQIREPTPAEQKTSAVAGSTIFEAERYLQELEEAMIQERKKASELKKDLEHAQQEADQLELQCAKATAEIEERFKQADQNCRNKQIAIETIFLMIKQEQIISKEIQMKSELLQAAMENVHKYMMLLDQFYQNIKRNKLDGNDPRENKLKRLTEVFADEYSKQKDNHKDSLHTLKVCYEKFDKLNKRVEVDLTQKRREIFEFNREYEALIFDTENDI